MATNKAIFYRTAYRGAAFGLQAGILVWIILLLQQSMAARGDPTGSMHQVTFGPLLLLSLGKRQTEQQTSADFTFQNGMLPYVVLWLVAGIIGAVIIRWLVVRDLRQPTETGSAT